VGTRLSQENREAVMAIEAAVLPLMKRETKLVK
jgi:hypothetical protein